MSKQTLMIFLLAGFAGFNMIAQNTVSFGYDNNGNRTGVTRSITLKSSGGEDDAKTHYLDSIGGHNVLIYPNPVKANLTIDITSLDDEEKAALYLYDSEGKLIKNIDLVKEGSSVSMEEMPSGIYILIIDVNNEKEKWRIIKQ